MDVQILFARLKEFCLPGGEDAARSVRGVRLREAGEIRSAPAAKWSPFQAEEVIRADRSEFRWEARFTGMTVIDAYEGSHGRLSFKLGGFLPIKTTTGSEMDCGELQRYLSSLALCPSMLLLNASLVWSATGTDTLRMSDGAVSVDLTLSENGSPELFRALRPRLLGKRTQLTPWSAVSREFQEWEGLRVAGRVEARWTLPEGEFTYYRAEVTPVEAFR